MSSVKIIKNEELVRFDNVKVGSFFDFAGNTYLRYEVVDIPTKGQPRNAVRIPDGASIRFEPHNRVKPHKEVELHLK